MSHLHVLPSRPPPTERAVSHRPFAFARALGREWTRVDGTRLAAALAFYAVLSLTPFLMVVVAITGWLLGSDAGTRYLLSQIAAVAGMQTAAFIGTVVAHAHPEATREGVRALVGIAVTLAGATALFAHLQHGLDQIFGSRWRGAVSLLRARLLSFLLVVGVSILAIVSLGVSAAVNAMVTRIAPVDLGRAMIGAAMNEVISFVVLALAFAAILRVLPECPPRRHAVWIGALSAAVLFVLGKFAIAWYLGHFALASAYGAAGAIVVVMLWIYGTSALFFLGAVIARTVDRMRAPDLVTQTHKGPEQ
jgi:membrane protein